jgi:UDP-glucose 4-epimerase
MQSAKILVTGAAGFIGSHLCIRLLHNPDAHVIGIDSLRSGSWSRTPSELIRVERDLREFSVSDWLTILEGVDVVYHLAAEKYNSSRSTPEKVLTTNILATERLFRASALAGVKRVVFTSSLYAYGSMGPKTMRETDLPQPTTLYGASKLMGENLLRSIDSELGLSWNVARLFFIYGPNQFAEGGYKSVIAKNFERIIDGNSPIVLGDGTQSLDYVYIRDCVDALMALQMSETDRMILNVSSGRATSILTLTKQMLEVAGSHLSVSHGEADWTAKTRRVGNAHLAEQRLGWRAHWKLKEGLEDVYHWMLKSKSDE